MHDGSIRLANFYWHFLLFVYDEFCCRRRLVGLRWRYRANAHKFLLQTSIDGRHERQGAQLAQRDHVQRPHRRAAGRHSAAATSRRLAARERSRARPANAQRRGSADIASHLQYSDFKWREYESICRAHEWFAFAAETLVCNTNRNDQWQRSRLRFAQRHNLGPSENKRRASNGA